MVVCVWDRERQYILNKGKYQWQKGSWVVGVFRSTLLPHVDYYKNDKALGKTVNGKRCFAEKILDELQEKGVVFVEEIKENKGVKKEKGDGIPSENDKKDSLQDGTIQVRILDYSDEDDRKRLVNKIQQFIVDQPNPRSSNENTAKKLAKKQRQSRAAEARRRQGPVPAHPTSGPGHCPAFVPSSAPSGSGSGMTVQLQFHPSTLVGQVQSILQMAQAIGGGVSLMMSALPGVGGAMAFRLEFPPWTPQDQVEPLLGMAEAIGCHMPFVTSPWSSSLAAPHPLPSANNQQRASATPPAATSQGRFASPNNNVAATPLAPAEATTATTMPRVIPTKNPLNIALPAGAATDILSVQQKQLPPTQRPSTADKMNDVAPLKDCDGGNSTASSSPQPMDEDSTLAKGEEQSSAMAKEGLKIGARPVAVGDGPYPPSSGPNNNVTPAVPEAPVASSNPRSMPTKSLLNSPKAAAGILPMQKQLSSARPPATAASKVVDTIPPKNSAPNGKSNSSGAFQSPQPKDDESTSTKGKEMPQPLLAKQDPNIGLLPSGLVTTSNDDNFGTADSLEDDMDDDDIFY